MSQSAEKDVSLAIKAQNPDLETAWRTIAWWEQTCAYWREEAYKGYALRDSLATRVLPPAATCSHGEPEGECASCAACAACRGECGVCPYVTSPGTQP